MGKEQKIGLRPDDAAMLIHSFSLMNQTDREKRLEQLNQLIDDKALIYQLPDSSASASKNILNKQEFISQLAGPESTLRNIEILEARRAEGKITVLRFYEMGKQP